MAIAIMLSSFGCDNGLILSGARVYYAMAKDGLFFRSVARLHPKYKTPAVSLMVQMVWTCVLCISGSYGQLLDYIVFAVLVFYILTIVGLFVLRRTHPEAERPYRAVGYPVLPAIYIVMALFIDVVLLRYKPQYTWPGLCIVLLGIPVYYLWSRDLASIRLTSRRMDYGESFRYEAPRLMMLSESPKRPVNTALSARLAPVNLIALGIGAIIGAGIFVLTGPGGSAVLRTRHRPLVHPGRHCLRLRRSLLLPRFARPDSGCGQAYTYAYATLGEMVAWIIGWDLILEYAAWCSHGGRRAGQRLRNQSSSGLVRHASCHRR